MKRVRAEVETHTYQPKWIPAGTKVKSRRRAGRFGIVLPYQTNQLGLFSVTFNDGLTEVVTADDVAIAIEPATKKSGAA